MTESSNTYTKQDAGDEQLPIGVAARILGVTVATVRRWEAAGHIVATRTPGGQRRFPRAEVDRIRRGTPAAS